jgi:methionine synthase II (cobalamin-independent)
METWSELRTQIRQWSRGEINDEEFYCYLRDSVFELEADRRVANLFIIQHDNGEWSHVIYHRMR